MGVLYVQEAVDCAIQKNNNFVRLQKLKNDCFKKACLVSRQGIPKLIKLHETGSFEILCDDIVHVHAYEMCMHIIAHLLYLFLSCYKVPIIHKMLFQLLRDNNFHFLVLVSLLHVQVQYMNTHTHTHTCTHTHAHTHTRTPHTCTPHTCTHTCTHTHAHHTHAHTHAHIRTHMHTHTRTHACTHTHTLDKYASRIPYLRMYCMVSPKVHTGKNETNPPPLSLTDDSCCSCFILLLLRRDDASASTRAQIKKKLNHVTHCIWQ